MIVVSFRLASVGIKGLSLIAYLGSEFKRQFEKSREFGTTRPGFLASV
jgi:hypothetical protein